MEEKDVRLQAIDRFREFGLENDVTDKAFTDGERCIINMQKLTVSSLNLMSRAFEKYVGGDFSAEKISELVSEQGYPVEDLGEDCFSTTVAGRRVRVWVGNGAKAEVPAAGERSIVFHRENFVWNNRIEHYPYLAAAMFSCLDPRAPRDIAL